MKYFLLGIFALSCGSSPVSKSELSLKDLMSVTRSDGGSYSPDHTQIAYNTNKSGIYNIWVYDLKSKKHHHLIQTPDRALVRAWSKVDGNIYFTSDKNGNENFNLYIYNIQTKKIDCVKCGESTNAQFYGQSESGNEIYFLDNSRDARYFDFFEYKIHTREIKKVFEQKNMMAFDLYLEKENKAILTENLGDDKNNVYLLNLKTKKIKKILGDGKNSFNPMDSSEDEKEIYFISNKFSEFEEGFKINLKTLKITKLLTDKWDILKIGKSFKSKFYYSVVNENGNYKIHLYRDEFKTEIPVPQIGSGETIINGIDRDEDHAVLSLHNDLNPGNLYSWKISTGEVKQFVQNLPKTIKPSQLVESKLLTYQTRDGLTISGYLYLPNGAIPPAGYPTIMWIHGGPKSQFTPGFSYAHQYLVNQGFAIFAPNIRGSTGYGKKFHMMDNKDIGGKALLDIIDGKNYLQTLPVINKEKIGILGGSYGGYMVLAALAFTPNEFDAGVDIVGPSNLQTLLESFPAYWTSALKYIYEEFGNPKKDKKFLKERSPLFKADQIKAPLIIFHGKNDARVKLSEAQSIYEAINKRRGVVELHVYDNEGHGFNNKNNIEDYLIKTNDFLKKHLR